MDEEKYYYEISDDETGEGFFCSVNIPVKEDTLCDSLGLEGYTARQITKEEYDRECADEEDCI